MTRRPQFLRSVAALVALGFAQAGCSKSPTAPAPATLPVHFAVFTSTRDGTHNYITDLDGSGAAKFVIGTASGIMDRHPSITESGSLLVYQSSPGRGGSEDVFAFNRSSGSVIDDSNVNTTANETDPYLSLDGTRVAFVRDTLGQKRIRLYDTQSLLLIPLPNLPGASGNDWQPALDRTGSRIAFVSNRNGNADVFVYDVGTQTLRNLPLLVSPGDDVEPSVSGNGRYVGFASNRSGGMGGYDVLMLDINTNQLVTLTANSTSNDRDPSVSNDASRIHFVSDRAGGAGGRDLWFYNHAAGTVVRVTNQNSAVEDYDPVIIWP